MPFKHAQSPRCHGPRVLTGYTLDGSDIVILENELLKVVINAGRGAMVHEFQYKPAGLDVLYKNPNGLRPHNSWVTSSYEGHPLTDHHPGGWYECFPSGASPVKQGGAYLGFHGEIYGQPFEVTAAQDSDGGCSATMVAYTVRTPWKLEKTYSLKSNDPTLYLDEVATNLGTQDLDVHWGQHPMFGPPFLDEHCRIEVDATSFFDERDKPMVRLRWPKTNDGTDLSIVRPQRAAIHKMAFVTDFSQGRYRVVSPTWGLAFEMCWDANLFPYCWLYENAGLLDAPWWGRSYTLALEPFTGMPKALEEGHGVISIPAGKSQAASFQARIVKA